MQDKNSDFFENLIEVAMRLPFGASGAEDYLSPALLNFTKAEVGVRVLNHDPNNMIYKALEVDAYRPQSLEFFAVEQEQAINKAIAVQKNAKADALLLNLNELSLHLVKTRHDLFQTIQNTHTLDLILSEENEKNQLDYLQCLAHEPEVERVRQVAVVSNAFYKTNQMRGNLQYAFKDERFLAIPAQLMAMATTDGHFPYKPKGP